MTELRKLFKIMNETTKHNLGTENFVWYFFSPRFQVEYCNSKFIYRYATVCFLTMVDRQVSVYLFIFSLLFVKMQVPLRLTPDKLANQIRIWM